MVAGILQNLVHSFSLWLIQAQSSHQILFDICADDFARDLGMRHGHGDHSPHDNARGHHSAGETGHEHQREQANDLERFHPVSFPRNTVRKAAPP